MGSDTTDVLLYSQPAVQWQASQVTLSCSFISDPIWRLDLQLGKKFEKLGI